MYLFLSIYQSHDLVNGPLVTSEPLTFVVTVGTVALYDSSGDYIHAILNWNQLPALAHCV